MQIPGIVVEEAEFLGTLLCSNPQDGLTSHFPDPKVVLTFKRTSLEIEYLLPAGYNIVIPMVDATMNKPLTRCVTVYCVTLNYGLRFPLHHVITDILTRYELAPT